MPTLLVNDHPHHHEAGGGSRNYPNRNNHTCSIGQTKCSSASALSIFSPPQRQQFQQQQQQQHSQTKASWFSGDGYGGGSDHDGETASELAKYLRDVGSNDETALTADILGYNSNKSRQQRASQYNQQDSIINNNNNNNSFDYDGEDNDTDHDNKYNYNASANDTTLSGTFLETALEEMRRTERIREETQQHQQQQQISVCTNAYSPTTMATKQPIEAAEGQKHPSSNLSRREASSVMIDIHNDSQTMEDRDDFNYNRTTSSSSIKASGRPLLDEVTNHPPRIPHTSSTSFDCTPFELPTFQPLPRPRRHAAGRTLDGKAGPMEALYHARYRDFVKGTIRTFQRQHPDRLHHQDYASMDPADKQREQRRVLRLLTRLGIHDGNAAPNQSDLRTQPTANISNKDTNHGTATLFQQHNGHGNATTDGVWNGPQGGPSAGTLGDVDDDDATVDDAPNNGTLDCHNDNNTEKSNTCNKHKADQAHPMPHGDDDGGGADDSIALLSPQSNHDDRDFSDIMRDDGSFIALLSPDPGDDASMGQEPVDTSLQSHKSRVGHSSNAVAHRSPTSHTSVSPAASSSHYPSHQRQRRSHSTTPPSSVEQVRSCLYESPPLVHMDDSTQQLQHKKRLASTSGKRGTDTARARTGDSGADTDNYNPGRNEDDMMMIAPPPSSNSDRSPPIMDHSPSRILETSIRRLSLAVDKDFALTQTPMSLRDENGSNDEKNENNNNNRNSPASSISSSGVAVPAPDISFGEEGEEYTPHHRPNVDDSIQDTMMLEKRVRWNVDGKEYREIPGMVGLKSGATFHLAPLPTEQRGRTGDLKRKKTPKQPSLQSFPDPLDGYQGRIERRMRRLYDWLYRRDKLTAPRGDGGPGARAILLSLDYDQVRNIILKLLLKNPRDEAKQRQATDRDKVLRGGTLIVTRDKGDLDLWGQTFREGSPFSVVNHATMPPKERKSRTTSEKCARYDVVMTTFDALKSADVTVTLDMDGRVQTQQLGVAQDGWYSSKRTSITMGSQSQSQRATDAAPGESEPMLYTNKQLSTLHRLKWRRVIYTDMLGRKCFLAKKGTSRAVSARALDAEARFAFFNGCTLDENDTMLDELIASDRRALQSVASVLQLDREMTEESVIQETVVDLNDLKKLPANFTAAAKHGSSKS